MQNLKTKLNIKMKPWQWTIAILVIIIYFISGFFTSKISFFAQTVGLKDKTISLSKNTTSKCENQLMWWEFNDNGLNLNYNNFIIKKDSISLYGKQTDNNVGNLSLSDSTKIGTGFNGSFIASLNNILIDMDGDGKDDEVNISAKADTIYTRGFVPVNTFIKDSRFPLEVVLVGNYDLKVYFNNELLKNAEVTVTSEKDGINQKFITDSETGMIHIENMNVLRNNINVLYTNSNKYYLMSYVVEGHRLLSAEHFSALKNLGILILVSGIVIVLIMILRKIYSIKNRLKHKALVKRRG